MWWLLAHLLFFPTLGSTESQTITYSAERLSADLKSGTTRLDGNVRARGTDFSIRSQWGTYAKDPEEFFAGGGVTGVWRGDSVSCRNARIASADSVVRLYGAVNLFGSDGSFLAASRIDYYRPRELAILSGPITLHDSTATYTAKADTGWFFEGRQLLKLARNCTLIIRSEGDTVSVLSDSLTLDDLSRQVVAYEHVRFSGRDVSGRCERMEYSQENDAVVLTGNPFITSGSVECSGRRILLQRRGGVLKQVIVEKDTHAVRWSASADSSAAEHAWGDRMVLWLDHGDPSSILVTGNGKAIHQVQNDDGDVTGINIAEGDSLFLGIVGRTLTRIRVAGNARGRYTPSAAVSDLPGEDISYKARTLTYDAENGLLDMSGSSELESGTLRLTAAHVKLLVADQEMTAEGDAVLTDKDQEVTGDVMTFSLSRRQGVVRKGSTKFEEAFSFGERVARIDSRRLSIRSGRFTTCEQDEAHFYVTSPRMRVSLDDKVVGRPIVMWIHEVPVFWLPYWVFPIRRGRHSGFLMPHFSFRNIVGLEGSHARIEDIGYYFVFDDYADLTMTLDWQEDQGWTAQAAADYALRYRLQGAISASYARWDDTQWILSNRHSQSLPYGFRLTADIRATGSKEFLDDQTWDTEERLDQNSGLRSDVTVSNNIKGWSFRASLKRNQTWETEMIGDTLRTTRQTIATTLPEIAISKPTKRLFHSSAGSAPWYKELYASLSSSFRNSRTSTEDDTLVEDHNAGTVHTAQLSWRLPKILRKFSVSPQASYRESWIHLGREGATTGRMKNDRQGVVYNMGVSMSTKLYGLWLPPVGPVVAFRHVMTPQIGYSYTPDWFTYGWDFNVGRFSEGDASAYQESGFGSSLSKSRRVTLSLNNIFQAKVRRGDEIVRKDNLATLILATSYDLEAKAEDKDPWSTLSTTLNLQPWRALSWNLRMTHNPNRDLEFGSLSSTASLRLRGGWNRPPLIARSGEMTEKHSYTWSLSPTHTYTHTRGSTQDQQNLRLTFGFAPSNGWDVQGTVSYDVTDRKILTKSIALVRDLHCWQMNLSWSQTDLYWRYDFKIFVRAYPQALFVEHKERG